MKVSKTYMKILISDTTRDFGSGFRVVFDSLDSFQTKCENIEYDFSQCGFINPSFLLPLVALKGSSVYSNRIIIKNLTFSNRVSSYLDTMHFPDAYATANMSEQELEKFLSTYSGKSYVPIICFPGTNSNADATKRDMVIGSIGDLLADSLKLNPNAHSVIMMLLSELTNNIGDHADINKGYIVAQHFAGNHYLDICIADCGMGILKAFQTEKPALGLQTSDQAIERAVRGESTKQDAIGRGFGLSGSIEMLRSLGGQFILCSGDCSFVSRTSLPGGIVNTPNGISWPGCWVLIRVTTRIPAGFNYLKFYS